ncbi:MAG: CPBP family intramembrane glutamic endopeptidase [Candidatus Methanosuratincola petrocarbonis]
MRRPSPSFSNVIQRLSLDVVAFVLIISSVILSYFIFTQAVETDVALAVKAAFMSSFVFSGLIFRPAVTGAWNFKFLSPEDFIKSASGGAIAFAALVVLVAVQTPAMSQLDFPARLFYANMAIVEEVFFNYFLFAWICTIYPWPVAALLVGGFFAPFHLGVYGMNIQFMAFAVLARVVLCAVYYVTGSLSSSMAAHMVWNILAAESGSVVVI